MVADAHAPGEGGTIRRVRRLVRWTAVTLGVLALVRWLKRRRTDTAIDAEAPTGDPADDLRRTLAASRSETTSDATEEAVQGAEEQPLASESVDERRASVHAQGRSALSDMAPGDES
jgi:hypothetical protein